MPSRWGPGPVFVYESIIASRRWQQYALRSLAVFSLLASMSFVWWSESESTRRAIDSGSIHQMAALGQEFYYAIASVQIALVLLAAPAATAGSVCLDRARGTLTHMLVTDLSDVEIVVGKLFARLAPVFAVIAAALPVLAIATLLGGVDPWAVTILALVSLVLAVFGCSLAMAFSVRATKTHEVLMAVYTFWAIVILGPPVWALISMLSGYMRKPPEWLYLLDPFYLAMWPGTWGWSLILTLVEMLIASCGLVFYSVKRLRSEASRTGRRRKKAKRKRKASWWPGPSLDGNPVLWRDWQRGRPSRMARVVWTLFGVAACWGTLLAIATLLRPGPRRNMELIPMMNALQVMFGLLLVSIVAPTALAEERVRGSLDVLMTTPLSTAKIVLGKWWAVYRLVPRLAILPACGLIVMVFLAPEFARSRASIMGLTVQVTVLDRFAAVIFPVAWLLVQGATCVSFGLLFAILIPQVGRAVTASVGLFVVGSIGGIITLEAGVVVLLNKFGYVQGQDSENYYMAILSAVGSLNPIFSQIAPAMVVAQRSPFGTFGWLLQSAALALNTAVAAGVLGLALLSFNRCMGRVPERNRRAPRRRAQVRQEPVSELVQAGHP